MITLAYLTGFLFLALLLLLALPVELRLHVENEERLTYGARLHWLFGLVSVDLTKIARKAVKKPKKHKPKRKMPSLQGMRDGNTSFLQVLRLLRGLLHSFRIKELTLYGRIGLGDPACTGMLMGVLQPLMLPAKNMVLDADYEEAVFEGRFRARISLVPIRVLAALALIFLSRGR